MANNLGLTVKPVAPTPADEERRVAQWIDTVEYRERNFARKALVVNPAHACQPLGAELAAHGFEGTLPLVHGSQGCTSYFRSTLNRHFREPAPAVSSAMTEDGAVYGGQNNLHEALENACALYRPKMIAVFTSCMPEIIGDDLVAFLENARQKGHVPEGLPVPCAHTPSFNGSHVNGWDAMVLAILQTLTEGRKVEGRCNGRLNLVPGFEPNTGNHREYRKILEAFGVPYTLLADLSESFDSPNDGTYRLYPGGTPLEDAADSVNARATIAVGTYSTSKTFAWIRDGYAGAHESLPTPMGIARTDAFLRKLSEVLGRPVPASLVAERGRAVDLMTDAHPYMHGKKFAVYGDPDQLLGTVSFLLEMGAVPYHVLASKGSKRLESDLRALLDGSPYGRAGKIWMNRDLWHLRSLLVTDPVDAVIGDTHGKFAARDAKVPLFRFGFPVFDRVGKHRFPTIGYQGVVHMVTEICNRFLDLVDDGCDERHFEMMR